MNPISAQQAWEVLQQADRLYSPEQVESALAGMASRISQTLAGTDPLHAWALSRRRRLRWGEGIEIAVAPPEYVVLRKLEYYREGGSAKHPADIRAICEMTGVDETAMAPWLQRLALTDLWHDLNPGG